jgi:hypothetical protein
MKRLFLALTFAFALVACNRSAPTAQQSFATPEDAARALIAAVKTGASEKVVAFFGADGKELVDSSDPVAAKRRRDVFKVAVAERWRLVDDPKGGKILTIGNEDWPFPVPLVKDDRGWRFDTAAGKEEILARWIGRNELAAIAICRTYVAAQRMYAQKGHDGLAPGLFAKTFRSDPGKQNGLYWRAGRGEKRSPLGDLLAQAAEERGATNSNAEPSPLHGYFFKILTAQGASAPGGAKDYVVNGQMSGGFSLVAWPAQYDVTGVMTFVVNHDGVVQEKDLGRDTATAAKSMTVYNPDASWAAVQ